MINETRSKAEKLKELEALIAEIYALRDQRIRTLPNNTEGVK